MMAETQGKEKPAPTRTSNGDPPCAKEFRVTVCKLIRGKKVEEHWQYLERLLLLLYSMETGIVSFL